MFHIIFSLLIASSLVNLSNCATKETATSTKSSNVNCGTGRTSVIINECCSDCNSQNEKIDKIYDLLQRSNEPKKPDDPKDPKDSKQAKDPKEPKNENCTEIKRQKRTRGKYIGCYQDQETRGISEFVATSALNSVDKCVDICRAGNFVFSAVQSSQFCLCGNTMVPKLNKKLEENKCNYACTGNKTQTCGSAWVNSVYETGLEAYVIDENGKERGTPYIEPNTYDYKKY